MAEVFRRPSLTGLEALWRWAFWCAVLAWPVLRLYPTFAPGLVSLQASGIGSEAFGFSPHDVLHAVDVRLGFVLIGCVVLWILLSALGRKLLLRRMDPVLRPGFAVLLILGLLRWLGWAVTVGIWLAGMSWAGATFVQRPVAQGGEAQWVGFCGVAIFGTLVLFVAWLAASWVFGLAIVFAGRTGATAIGSLLAAWRSGPLRSKVAEINLVMGIVKIALIVLAMVFSASPLPFETVETQLFLVMWTAGVLLLYVVASDYFHVVRLVAFLRMTEVFAPLPLGAAARGSEAVS